MAAGLRREARREGTSGMEGQAIADWPNPPQGGRNARDLPRNGRAVWAMVGFRFCLIGARDSQRPPSCLTLQDPTSLKPFFCGQARAAACPCLPLATTTAVKHMWPSEAHLTKLQSKHQARRQSPGSSSSYPSVEVVMHHDEVLGLPLNSDSHVLPSRALFLSIG